jgi:hypothetical protein
MPAILKFLPDNAQQPVKLKKLTGFCFPLPPWTCALSIFITLVFFGRHQKSTVRYDECAAFVDL